MKITRETLTVVADPRLHEISVLLSGLRITLEEDEARSLSDQLTSALRQVAEHGAPAKPRPAPQRGAVPGIGALIDAAG